MTVQVTTETVSHDPAVAWPARMQTNAAADYLQRVHGLPIKPKTLRNKRCERTGPRCRYFGSVPLYDRAALDDWAESEALADRPANLRKAA